MQLYNTLSRKKERLPAPIEHPEITFYTCGPTVYDETHIGHMRKYTMDDVLKRSLEYLGYKVRHVMNITDVGHLTGDDDSGEDKLEKGAKKQGKTVWDLAKEYEKKFWETMEALNIQKEAIKVIHATKSIDKMIELNKTLEEKGYTYQTDQALYFDVSKFENYGKLSGQKLQEKIEGAREEVHVDSDKKHPADFALWFKKAGRFADHTMHWDSPWGEGFPGWHIECSAMSISGLGIETIDIHTGGIDHIPVHHENEIAQSEAATGKKFVKWWVHHAFLQVDGEKMSKSKENFYTLKDIQEKKLNPFALRYLFLQTHYRKPMNFTWEAVESAQTAYRELQGKYQQLQNLAGENTIKKAESLSGGAVFMLNKLKEDISDDLNLARAIGDIWYMLRSSDLRDNEKLFILKRFNRVMGLELSQQQETAPVPEEVTQLVMKREQARKEKNFEKSDELRTKIKKKGYTIEDTQDGFVIKKK